MQLSIVTVVVLALALTVLLPGLAFGYLFARYANLPERLAMLGRPLGIDRWAAAGPTLLFLVAFGWLSVAGDLPAEGEPGRIPLLLSVFGLLAGLFGVALALGNLGRYRRLRADEAVSGTADIFDERTATAPISGADCLAWAVRVREHSGLFRRGGPPPIHRESGGVPFTVQSPVDRVRVDPNEATLDVWSVVRRAADETVRVRDGELPETVERFTMTRDLADADDSRRYEEVRIEPGETVTVLGEAPAETGAVGDGVAYGGPGTRIVDASGEAVRRRIRRRVRAGPAGAALALVSFAVAALVAGVV